MTLDYEQVEYFHLLKITSHYKLNAAEHHQIMIQN